MPDLLTRLQVALAERYSIERELGHGGMATVYLAREVRHDRLVAMKALRPDLAYSVGPERFLLEIRMTAGLDHPHILSVFESGEADGLLWYTMPFVDGETLRDRLRRESQLPVGECIRLSREIADALEYAHQRGVVHRDIKPENILLASGHARVADFGVARALEVAGAGRLTETGLAVGTPIYMSPEQATGGPVDGRSDQYSLACMLYEMLTGEPPYTGPTAQAVIAKKFSEPVPHVRTLRLVPFNVETALTRGLAKSPADRFDSVTAFARALESPDQLLKPRPQLGRLQAALLGLLIVAALAYGVLSFSRSTGDTSPDTVESRVAVLPLENLGDPADEFFADGLSDEIRGQLSRVSGLTVISRATMKRISNGKSPEDVAKLLNVGYLLAGTVRWVRDSGGSRIQVRPELIHARDGATRWQQTYDSPLRDLFSVQTDIAERAAREIVTALGSVPRLGPSSILAGRPTPKTEAYLRYLRGLAELNRDTRESLREAERLLSEAIKLDSTFGEAYAGLADALNFQTTYVRPRKLLERMRAAAQRAVELDRHSPVTHTALAGVEFWFDWDLRSAERSLRRALELDPNYARAYHYLTYLLTDLGRIDEALSVAREARLRDPLSEDAARVQFVPLFESRRYDDVITLARQELAIDASSPAAIEFLGGALVQSGKSSEGLAVLRRGAAMRPTCGMQRMLAVSFAFAGQRDSAQVILDRWRRDTPCPGTPEPHFAQVYAALGEADSAFAWLERGYAARVPHMIDLGVVQGYQRLWKDPRYAEMLRRVGVPGPYDPRRFK